MSYLNRLPFSNLNSDSGVLYIVFKRFHLIFPVAHLDFQVEARFMRSLSNLAYASHIASRIAYHHCIILFDPCTWLIVSLLLVCLVAFRWLLAVYHRPVPYLNRLPFTNRASDSGDLYIDFNRNHLIIPAAYLVCQVDALFIIFPSEARICIAYHISHIMTCIASCCLCIAQ